MLLVIKGAFVVLSRPNAACLVASHMLLGQLKRADYLLSSV